MIVIARDRGRGKTTELLKWVKKTGDNPRFIVVQDEETKRSLEESENVPVLTFADAISYRSKGLAPRDLAFDNIELSIGLAFPVDNIAAITVTPD